MRSQGLSDVCVGQRAHLASQPEEALHGLGGLVHSPGDAVGHRAIAMLVGAVSLSARSHQALLMSTNVAGFTTTEGLALKKRGS